MGSLEPGAGQFFLRSGRDKRIVVSGIGARIRSVARGPGTSPLDRGAAGELATASQLHLSEASAKTHQLHAIGRLEVRDRTRAVTRATELCPFLASPITPTPAA